MVLVTGASGFVGGNCLAQLQAAGLAVRAMIRPGHPRQFYDRGGIAVAEADVTVPESLPAALAGVDTVVHLVGTLAESPGVTHESLVAEGTRSLVAAAAAAGVQRVVYLSTLGADRNAPSRYHRTRAIAEEAVRASQGGPVILRSSLIYGPGDRFLTTMVSSSTPLPGDGATLVQPIHVDDVGAALVAAATLPAAAGRTIDLAGPEQLSLAALVQAIGVAAGRPRLHARLPRAVVETGAWLWDRFGSHLPATALPLSVDLLAMLQVDFVGDITALRQVLGVEPRGLAAGLRQSLAA